MNESLCIPGLQGLPIQVTGWIGYQKKDELLVPNDLHFQFAPKGQPIQSTTFFLNGTQYFVAEIRYVQPKQEGLKIFSENPFAEIHIWGKPTATALNKETFALLSIPLYESFQGIVPSDDLETLLPQGANVQIIKYSTCIERQEGTSTIQVAYWASGLGVKTEARKKFTNLSKYGIPLSLTDKNLFLSSYKQYNDEKKTKAQRVYNQENETSIPYFSTVTLGTTSPEFQKSFRLIKGFQIKQVNSSGQDVNNYKCVRIQRETDIKDGQIMIDASTGKSLKEETDEMQKALEFSLKGPPDTSSKKTYILVFTIVGILLGISAIALIVYAVQFMLSTRDVAGLPEPSSNVKNVVNPSGNTP